VFVLAFSGDSYDRSLVAASEVRARGGCVILVTDREDATAPRDERLVLPACDESLAPILAVLPFQLLGRELALLLGRDVDRPRNLAKSVTTE
ncbi:MAG: glutamine--fructose-6-phosphate aminotransferase, partial [Spirochaetaceae bacterium]|nr:glutamine--fructose-6-phosphate aminotransferase [Spirochaetaceae bacterium]